MDGNTAENLTKEPAAGCFGRIVAPPLIEPYQLTFAFSGFPLGDHTKLLRQAGLDAEVEADRPDGRGKADAESGCDCRSEERRVGKECILKSAAWLSSIEIYCQMILVS